MLSHRQLLRFAYHVRKHLRCRKNAKKNFFNAKFGRKSKFAESNKSIRRRRAKKKRTTRRIRSAPLPAGDNKPLRNSSTRRPGKTPSTTFGTLRNPSFCQVSTPCQPEPPWPRLTRPRLLLSVRALRLMRSFVGRTPSSGNYRSHDTSFLLRFFAH